jgi:hypothetical protein
MKKIKMKKKNISAIIIFLAIVGIPFTVYAQTKKNNQIQYKVIEYPTKMKELYDIRYNSFVYFDNIETVFSSEENPEYVKISIFVGKADTAEEAIDKWAQNVHKLELYYKDILKNHLPSPELYGNFCWSKEISCIEIRYRTKKEKYPRDGWYISTSSHFPPHNENVDYGEYFLSDEGVLIPVMKVSSMAFYP